MCCFSHPLLRRCHLLFPARLLVLLLLVLLLPLLHILRPARFALDIILPRKFLLFFLLPIFIFISLLLFFFFIFLSFFFFFGRPRASRRRS